MERFVFQWHITHACNLRCSHCYQTEYQSHMPSQQLYEILDKFTAFAEKRNVVGQINLTGGEPLLHPEFLPLAKEIRRRGYRLGILTNGTLIDENWAEELAKLHPVFVQISLDGAEKAHDVIRGQGNFRKALEGVDRLKRRGVRVLVSFTAQKSNRHELKKLAAVCLRHKVDKLWWDRVVTEDMGLALSTEEFRGLVRISGALERKYRRRDGSSLVTNQRSLQFLGCGADACGYHCAAGKSLIVVTADGGVMPCRRLPFTVGNILEADFDSIITESPVMRELRTRIYPAGCAGCEHLGKCGGGAKCVTYAQTGELFARDVNCWVER